MEFQVRFCHHSGLRLWRTGTLLSTKSKGHKSKFRISWMYRYRFYDLKVYFWCLLSGLKFDKACLNTLYIDPKIFQLSQNLTKFFDLHTHVLYQLQTWNCFGLGLQNNFTFKTCTKYVNQQKFGLQILTYRFSPYSFQPWIVSAHLFTVTFGLMYCDLWISKF